MPPRTALTVLPDGTDRSAEGAKELKLTLEDAYARFAPYVARIGQRLLGRRDEVKDLVQDVFLASRSTLHRLNSEGAARAWFGVVTVRMARRRLRRERLRQFFGLSHSEEADQVVDGAATPLQRAMVSSVYAALKKLPADHRVAWTLRHIEGAQLEEVAAWCGCSLATAKRWIAAAHVEITKVMRDE